MKLSDREAFAIYERLTQKYHPGQDSSIQFTASECRAMINSLDDVIGYARGTCKSTSPDEAEKYIYMHLKHTCDSRGVHFTLPSRYDEDYKKLIHRSLGGDKRYIPWIVGALILLFLAQYF